MIDTIIFDMGNVLIEWHPQKYLAAFEKDEQRQQLLYDALFTSGIWSKQDDGTLSTEQACKQSQQLLDPSLHEACYQMYFHWQVHSLAFKQMQSYAKHLQQLGYQLFILSNTSDVYYRIEQLGLLPISECLTGKILSFEEGLVKPDKAIYQLICQKYQLTPENCLFLDDIEENIQAAQSINMHGLLVKNEIQACQELKKVLAQHGKYSCE